MKTEITQPKFEVGQTLYVHTKKGVVLATILKVYIEINIVGQETSYLVAPMYDRCDESQLFSDHQRATKNLPTTPTN